MPKTARVALAGMLAVLLAAGAWFLWSYSQGAGARNPHNGAQRQTAEGQDAKARAAGLPKEMTLDLGKGVTLELLLIPAGKFMMGSPATEQGRDGDEGPQREVTITRPFYVGKHEVTQAQYEAVMGDNPSRLKDGPDAPRRPVERVSWEDAQVFCQRLNELAAAQLGGKEVRLPTEAEWEYACRAGTTTPFHTGETVSTAQANYDGNSAYGRGARGDFRQTTIPVGSLGGNAWGLRDMHGNVGEWCQDWYGPYEAGAVQDPAGAAEGNARVLRGGSWVSSPRSCRSAERYWAAPRGRDAGYGLRVVVAGRP